MMPLLIVLPCDASRPGSPCQVAADRFAARYPFVVLPAVAAPAAASAPAKYGQFDSATVCSVRIEPRAVSLSPLQQPRPAVPAASRHPGGFPGNISTCTDMSCAATTCGCSTATFATTTTLVSETSVAFTADAGAAAAAAAGATECSGPRGYLQGPGSRSARWDPAGPVVRRNHRRNRRHRPA